MVHTSVFCVCVSVRLRWIRWWSHSVGSSEPPYMNFLCPDFTSGPDPATQTAAAVKIDDEVTPPANNPNPHKTTHGAKFSSCRSRCGSCLRDYHRHPWTLSHDRAATDLKDPRCIQGPSAEFENVPSETSRRNRKCPPEPQNQRAEFSFTVLLAQLALLYC